MASISDPKGTDGAYYGRLELGPRASRDDIVRSYRRLALGLHPDAHPEDPEATRRFREITEAYEVLADPRRRAAYDRGSLFGDLPPRPCSDSAQGSSQGLTGAKNTSEQQQTQITFLGTTRKAAFQNVPLRVGPVRVETSLGTDESRPVLSEWILQILTERWRR